MNPMPPNGVNAPAVEQLLKQGAALSVAAVSMRTAPVHMCANCGTAVASNLIRERWLCEPCSVPALPAGLTMQASETVARMLGDLLDAVARLEGTVARLDGDVREVVGRVDEALAKFKGGPVGLLRTRRAA